MESPARLPKQLAVGGCQWKVQAIKGRPQAIELIDILGANGLERLVELADTTFNAAIETEAYD